MTPASGFYAVLDPRNRLKQSDFAAPGLPALQVREAGRWLSAWRCGALQGLLGEQGGRYLAFHGTLYNQALLATELNLPPDTAPEQVLFNAWTHWPDDWTKRLDGLYALAYWSDDGQSVALRRDSSGLLGLFYARTSAGCLAFSSRLDTLMRLPGVQRRIASQGLHEYLRLLDIAAPNTIFEGVRAVPPGEGVIIDVHDGHAETASSPPALPVVETSFETALDTVETLLQTSIDRRLNGIAHPAAFLSGGIDSSLICALAAPKYPKLEAITVGFDLTGYDETPVAEKVAGHLGLRQRVLRFDREEILRAVNKAGLHAEQPMADPTEPVTLLAFERAQQDYDAVLDGTGADEQMGAMPPRHIRVAVAYAALLPASVRRSTIAALTQMPRLAAYAPILDFDHPADLMVRWKGFTREEIQGLCGTPASLEHTRFFEVFSRFPRSAHFERYSALMGIMPSDRLSQSALMTDLDVRFPFCASQLELYLRGLPHHYRWREGEPKRILRALLARRVPRHLWDVPKHGFNFPLTEFLSADDFEVVRRYLLPGQWASWQLLAPERVRTYARRFIAGERQLSIKIWALVVLAAWLEKHLD